MFEMLESLCTQSILGEKKDHIYNWKVTKDLPRHQGQISAPVVEAVQ